MENPMDNPTARSAQEYTFAKRTLRSTQLYLEEHSAIRLLGYAAYYLLSTGGFYLQTVQAFGGWWTPTHTALSLALCLGIALFFDLLHVARLRGRMLEMLKRDRHIEALRRFIHHATNLQKVDYEYDTYRLEYHFDREGNGRCVRRTVIRPLGRTVYCQDFYCGAMGGSPGLIGSDAIGLTVYARPRDDENAPLIPQPFIFLEDYAAKKEGVIILDPPASPQGTPHTVITEHSWPGLWSPLVEGGTDVGRVRVPHRIRRFELWIHAPRGFRLTRFQPHQPDYGGTCTLAKATDETHFLAWTVDDVGTGALEYTVHGEWERQQPTP